MCFFKISPFNEKNNNNLVGNKEAKSVLRGLLVSTECPKEGQLFLRQGLLWPQGLLVNCFHTVKPVSPMTGPSLAALHCLSLSVIQTRDQFPYWENPNVNKCLCLIH